MTSRSVCGHLMYSATLDLKKGSRKAGYENSVIFSLIHTNVNMRDPLCLPLPLVGEPKERRDIQMDKLTQAGTVHNCL